MKEGITIEEWYARVKLALKDEAKECAQKAHEWAYDNRVWTDHQGTKSGQGARGNLHGGVIDIDDGNHIGFYVAQGVEYGKHLETVSDGKYGICKKAVEHFMPNFKTGLQDIMATWKR